MAGEIALTGIIVAETSGAALALLGVVLALARPLRSHTLYLSAFLILWGARTILANLWLYEGFQGNADAARGWFLASNAILIVVYLPLLLFAFTFPRRHGWLRRPAIGVPVVLLPSLVGAVLLVQWPGAFLGQFTGDPKEISVALGPAYYVFFGLLNVAFLIALFEMYWFYRGARIEIEKRQAGAAMLAFAAYAAYSSADLLASRVMDLMVRGLDQALASPAFPLVFIAPLGFVLLGFTYHAITARRNPAKESHLLTLAILLPATAGGLASGAARTGLSGRTVETWGLWMLVFAVLITYSVLRYQLFDLERRIEKTLVLTGLWTVAGLVAFVILRGLESTLELEWVAQLAFLTFVTVAGLWMAYGSVRYWRKAASQAVPGWSSRRRQESLHQQVYEAALAAQDPTQTEPNTQIFGLRAKLGLAEGEEAALRQLVFGAAIAPTSSAEAGDWVAERYQVERRLARGGFGQTFLTWDTYLARRVVLKQLHEIEKESLGVTRAFLVEARMAARVEHPNLTRVYDFGITGTRPYIVSEYVKGSNLAEHLRRRGRLEAPESFRVIRGVLRGLGALHAAGVVHGDLKPANIVLDGNGSPKITDFGSAIVKDHGHGAGNLPTGSPAFMSPEVAEGETATEQSDLYSVGAILYTLVSGHPPFELDGLGLDEMRSKLLDEPTPLPSDVALELRLLVMNALARSPRDRHPDCAMFLEAVKELSAKLTRPRTTRESGRRVTSRRASGGAPRPSRAAPN